MYFRKSFFPEIVLSKINFSFGIVLFESARKTQNLRILRGKLNQKVIYCVHVFFQNRAF